MVRPAGVEPARDQTRWHRRRIGLPGAARPPLPYGQRFRTHADLPGAEAQQIQRTHFLKVGHQPGRPQFRVHFQRINRCGDIHRLRLAAKFGWEGDGEAVDEGLSLSIPISSLFLTIICN